ncbi:MAG TPA: ABC transporter permease subunit [Methyloceanibacter sp.]|nr:ABC transporter permease subunit [Alphaproteobacteria bacterium]HUW73670.1 ABC transporter permease subunit [Methyloceanibacter sp.]
MTDEYGNIWTYRLKWAYTLLVVVTLMMPVFYVMFVSFNKNGQGAAEYVFTLEWYGAIFSDKLLIGALWDTCILAIIATIIVVPFGLLSAKFYKRARYKVMTVSLLLSPLFVPSDILGSALLVFFKNLNKSFEALSDWLGNEWFYGWFDLGYTTAIIGLVIYILPYVFVVILITMGRYREQQTEAARACGAGAWQAFWHVEFPQIRAGIFSSCAFALILSFNEYTRTSLLKGGYDTFTTVLISQFLNEGMSEQSYALSSAVSFIAIAVIGAIIVFTLIRSEKLERVARAKTQPVMST